MRVIFLFMLMLTASVVGCMGGLPVKENLLPTIPTAEVTKVVEGAASELVKALTYVTAGSVIIVALLFLLYKLVKKFWTDSLTASKASTVRASTPVQTVAIEKESTVNLKYEADTDLEEGARLLRIAKSITITKEPTHTAVVDTKTIPTCHVSMIVEAETINPVKGTDLKITKG